jgi:hypothetical protein
MCTTWHNSTTAVDEDDVPAISKRQEMRTCTAASSTTFTPMSIQDYLKNQQRK